MTGDVQAEAHFMYRLKRSGFCGKYDQSISLTSSGDPIFCADLARYRTGPNRCALGATVLAFDGVCS